SYTISVTAIDAVDPALRTTQSFVLSVELPDDPSTIINLPPGINFIDTHAVRVGDNVVMEVKATDPNGTIPILSSLDLPDGASFEPHPEFNDTKVLRWTPERSNLGSRTLTFRAVDSVNSSLQAAMSVILEIREPSDFTRPGQRLKTLAALQNIQIGYASLLQFYNRPDADLYQSVVREEFSLVTPENSMKWAYINPEPGEYRWEAADRLIAFAAASDMLVHGHTLVWYAALPQWVQQSPVDEREELMYEFIDSMTSRYPTVAIWDVVNEAFEDDGSYRYSTWFEAMGKSHISKAFFHAEARAPAAVLLYNDYDIAYAGPKSEAVLELMEELLDDGVPVDGIGLQMHLDTRFNRFDSIRERMAAFAALGLDIYITELDVSIVDGGDEQDQARVYESVVTACLQQSACQAIQFWGITDRYSWRKAFDPLPLDAEYQAKPAYLAVQRALAGE
ncbi:MAG: endo-1,4-beta-xylanase, partial [Granulosicoccus sp.]